MTNYVWPAKFGDEILDYVWDWTARLEEDETIVSVTASASGNPAIEIVTSSTTANQTTVWISGGGSATAPGCRINLLATTSSVPARKLGEQIALQVKGR
jgi:hypothetical protein